MEGCILYLTLKTRDLLRQASLYIYQANYIIYKEVKEMKKAKIEAILAEKEAELVTLSQRSVNAVQAVRNSIDNLTAINTGIETTVA